MRRALVLVTLVGVAALAGCSDDADVAVEPVGSEAPFPTTVEVEVRDPSDHLAEVWIDDDPSGGANGLTVDGTTVTATFPACPYDLVRLHVFSRVGDGDLEEVVVLAVPAERPGACAEVEGEPLQRVHLRFQDGYVGETVTLSCADPDCGASVTIG